jgi:hypothetical protein
MSLGATCPSLDDHPLVGSSGSSEAARTLDSVDGPAGWPGSLRLPAVGLAACSVFFREAVQGSGCRERLSNMVAANYGVPVDAVEDVLVDAMLTAVGGWYMKPPKGWDSEVEELRQGV